MGTHEKIFLSETTTHRALISGVYHHLVNLYQVCSNDIPGAKNGPTQESHRLKYIKSTFSEYGHVAYQIKGNEAHINMLANILSLYTSLTPREGSKCHVLLFCKDSYVA